MTEPANLCWGIRTGPVSQSVVKQLCSSAATHLIGSMLRDLVCWTLGPGRLSIALPSRWVIEQLYEQLQEEPSKLALVLNNFVSAINGIEPSYDLNLDEWTINFVLAEPVIKPYNHEELQLCIQVQMTRSPVPATHGLDPVVAGQLEDILSEVEMPSVEKENELMMPDCADCGSPVVYLEQGAVSFYSRTEENGVSEVNSFHVWCMPDDRIHSISLERLKNVSSALYWSSKLSSYPWFRSEKWWQVIGCLFPNLSPQ